MGNRCIITDEQQTVGILLMEHGEPNHVAAMLEYARLQMLTPPFMGRWNPAGLVSSPPLNTDGQHRIWNEGYSAITKPLSEIWEDMSLPKTAAELEEIAPPEGEITVGWWWNHESPDEESS